MSNQQKAIFNLLYNRPIAYNPGLVKAFGSVNAAIFIGQLLYWQGKGSKGEWIYKTILEFQNETGLSRAEQNTVIKIAKSLGVLEVERRGIPPVRHFKLFIPKIIELIGKSQSLKSSKSNSKLQANQTAENQLYNTESTPEKTSYSEIKNKNNFLERKIKELSDSKTIR